MFLIDFSDIIKMHHFDSLAVLQDIEMCSTQSSSTLDNETILHQQFGLFKVECINTLYIVYVDRF